MSYFTDDEFRCKCGRAECDAPKTMSRGFMRRIETLRTAYGKPIVINSGLRCAYANEKAGGVTGSEHMTGEGADIRCTSSSDRMMLVRQALLTGFKRIGIGKTFVHVGTSEAHSQWTMWLY